MECYRINALGKNVKMKKPNLIKETALCVFCRHRFKKYSSALHIQRKYFKFSHTALQRQKEPDNDPFASTNNFTGATWGISPEVQNETNKVSTGPTEKESNWGSTDDISSWATPIAKEFDNKELAATILSPHKSSESTENWRSIPEDQQAEVRELKLRPFPGPQSSRAGRPTPPPRPLVRRLKPSDNNYQSLNYHNHDIKTKNHAIELNENFSFKHNSYRSQIRRSNLEQSWSLLKRRGVTPVPVLNPVVDRSRDPMAERDREEREANLKNFAVDRKEREREAEFRRFTPLIGHSSFQEDNPPYKKTQENILKPSVENSKSSTLALPHASDVSNGIKSDYMKGSSKEVRYGLENLNLTVTKSSKPLGSWEELDYPASYGQNNMQQFKRNKIEEIYSSKIQEPHEMRYWQLNPEDIWKKNLNFTSDASQPRGSRLKNLLAEQATTRMLPTLPKKTLNSRSVLMPEDTPLEETVEEENEYIIKPKRKKEKKKRGIESRPLYEDEKSKLVGKDRDRARRDARILRDEEEQKDTRLRLEEKMERNRLKAEKRAAKKEAPAPILLPEFITVANLAMAIKIRYEDLATKMKQLGFEEIYPDFILNSENSGLIAMEYKFEPIPDKTEDMDLKPRDPHPNPTELPLRPPIVTIMGHVDHGKTTLLDYLRKSSVAASEHGGITQHIGAFSVRMPTGKMITFLDTPGHAAFLNMRQRGAYVTDIVVLVVAADDGVKPQTMEAIKHAKAAKVPIIVAINKIDKPDINIDKVKLDLARHGVEIEDFGGDTQVVCVSGQTGEGIDKFEETVMALAEILDMRAEVDCPTEGWILEASVKSLGKVATILVRRGTLRPGQVLVAGTTWSRVRVMRNEMGTEISEAGPGFPVEIDGWRDQPIPGDETLQAEDEIKAKRVVDYRIERKERDKLAADMEAINRTRDNLRQQKVLANIAREAEEDEENIGIHQNPPADLSKQKKKSERPSIVYFIVKGDVSGSIEAIKDQISLLKTKEVEPVVLRSGVGKVSKFDIEHAGAAKGYVVSFNQSVSPDIYHLAEGSKVRIFENNIIYALVDSIRTELSNYLPPIISHFVLGEAEIAQIYLINFKGRKRDPIAGCKVRNGLIKRNCKVRVIRQGKNIFEGELSSLKTGKKDVQQVSKGNECGLAFTGGWSEFEVGDLIQHYEERSEKRYL